MNVVCFMGSLEACVAGATYWLDARCPDAYTANALMLDAVDD